MADAGAWGRVLIVALSLALAGCGGTSSRDGSRGDSDSRRATESADAPETRVRTIATINRETAAARPRAGGPQGLVRSTAAAVPTSGTRLRGRVLLPDGAAPSEATIRAVLYGATADERTLREPALLAEAAVGEGGQYELEFAPHGEGLVCLEADASDAAPTRRPLPELTSRRSSIPVRRDLRADVRLLPAARVAGRVVASDGDAVSSASLRFLRTQDLANFETEAGYRGDATTATAEGTFEAAVAAGWVAAVAEAPGLVTTVVETTAPNELLEIRMARSGAIIEGLVFQQESGTPVPEATVILERDRAKDRLGVAFEPRAATTDLTGGFRFDLLAPGPYLLNAHSDSLGMVRDSAQKRGLEVTVEERATTGGVTLLVFGGYTLSGLVRERVTGPLPPEAVQALLDQGISPEQGAGGIPVDGARIEVLHCEPHQKAPASAQTGFDGRFLLSGLFPRNVPEAFITVEKEGYFLVQQSGDYEDGVKIELEQHKLVKDLTLAMDREVSIGGKVTLRDGAPASGAIVEFEREDARFGMRGARVGADGSYRLGVQPYARGYVAASMDGLPTTTSRYLGLRDDDIENLDLVLLPGVGPQLVEVVDGEDQPVAGARVRVSRWIDFITREVAAASADDAGRAVFASLPQGALRYEATFDGFVPATSTAGARLDQGPPDPVRLVLQSAMTISGVVMDEEGTPVGGADVSASQGGGNRWQRRTEYRAKSSAEDGSFTIQLPEGEYNLSASRLDARGELREVAAGTDDAAVVLRKNPYSFIGRVVDAHTGNPLPNFEVRIEPDTVVPVKSLEEPGRFDIADLSMSAAYRMTLTADGYATVRQTLGPRRGGDDTRRVETRRYEMGPYRAITGRVVRSSDSAPVEGVAVKAVRGGNRWQPAANVRPEQETRTGKDGRFVLSELTSGEFRVLIEPDKPLAQLSTNVTVKPEADADIGDVVLRGVAALKGKVVSGRGESPVPGARIVLMSRGMGGGGDRPPVATSDASGRFEFAEVVPGGYSLGIGRSGPLASVVLESGETKEVTLRMGGPTLRGRATYRGEQVPVMAEMVRGALNRPGRRTGDDGFFEVRDLEPGQWALVLRQMQRQQTITPTVIPVTMPATGDIEMDFELNAGEIRGVVVDDEDRPINNATVRLANGFEDPNATQRPGEIQVSTNQRGVFRIRGLAEGTYPVSVAVRNRPVIPAQQVAVPKGGDSDEVRFVVPRSQPGGTLISVALDAATGAGIGSAWCLLTEAGTGAIFHHAARRGNDGIMMIEGIPAGRYRVEVSASSYSIGTHDVRIVEGESVNIEDLLERSGALQIVVLDASGNPMARVPCTLQPSSGVPGGRREGETSVYGKWAARGLQPGKYRLTVRPPGKSTQSQDVEIYGAEVTDIAVTIN